MKVLHLREERGFTLMELLVAMVCTMIVLGSAVALTSQIQTGYRRQIENSAGEQEARYALDWIGRYLRSAGNDPHGAPPSTCLGTQPSFRGITIDPNNNNTIIIQSDINPPDELIGGPDCSQTNEHVTISFDEASHTIVFLDAVGTGATTRTDNVIDDLEFVYLGSDRGPTTDSDNVFYVQTRITIRTRTLAGSSGNPRVLTNEIRVRSR